MSSPQFDSPKVEHVKNEDTEEQDKPAPLLAFPLTSHELPDNPHVKKQMRDCDASFTNHKHDKASRNSILTRKSVRVPQEQDDAVLLMSPQRDASLGTILDQMGGGTVRVPPPPHPLTSPCTSDYYDRQYQYQTKFPRHEDDENGVVNEMTSQDGDRVDSLLADDSDNDANVTSGKKKCKKKNKKETDAVFKEDKVENTWSRPHLQEPHALD